MITLEDGTEIETGYMQKYFDCETHAPSSKVRRRYQGRSFEYTGKLKYVQEDDGELKMYFEIVRIRTTPGRTHLFRKDEPDTTKEIQEWVNSDNFFCVISKYDKCVKEESDPGSPYRGFVSHC